MARQRPFPERNAQVDARFSELLAHIPLLYLVALAAFGGLYWSTGVAPQDWANLILPIALLVVWRLVYWLRLGKRPIATAEKRRALIQLLLYATAISVGFSAWGHYLFATRPELALVLVLFSTMASMGCAFGLLSYPLAAAIPVVILGIPISLRLLGTGDRIHIATSICLLLSYGLILRILILHHRSIRKMVAGKRLLERERAKLIEAERSAAKMARIDTLTNLANRRAFLEALDAHKQVDDGPTKFTLALLDLDEFKPINDIFGHATGDAVLAGVAQALTTALPEDAIVARMGGDEFAIFCPGSMKADDCAAFAERICAAAKAPVRVDNKNLAVGASCGIVSVSSGLDVREALSRADVALYSAKQSPNSDFIIFDGELQSSRERHALIERKVVKGIAAKEISVAFQPIVDLRGGGGVSAVEALARWHDPQLGPISPMEFIPLAEQNGVIAEISEQCLARACTELRTHPGLMLSFNVSAIELCDPACADRLLNIIHRCGVAPRMLQLEVTETAPLSDMAIARQNLDHMREAGCTIALDDFGAGNASLKYLREMRFDVVKIDGLLVSSIVESTHCRQLLKATIDLCHTMGMRCVAEMVETQDQLRLLCAMGCDAAQGNYLSHPNSSLSHVLDPANIQGLVAVNEPVELSEAGKATRWRVGA